MDGSIINIAFRQAALTASRQFFTQNTHGKARKSLDFSPLVRYCIFCTYILQLYGQYIGRRGKAVSVYTYPHLLLCSR